MPHIKNFLMLMVYVSLLSGCIFSKAPKPPECKGEYRPVNVVEQKGASFDGTGKIVRCEDWGRHGHQG